jgi:hypothetical protein
MCRPQGGASNLSFQPLDIIVLIISPMLGINASFNISMKAGIRPITNAFSPAVFEEALKKVASDGQARRNQLKKRSLHRVNEHFESDFNAAWPSAVVFQMEWTPPS